ncbi:MAG: glycosyltransferase family 2 protein [Deltaproteobacteria bacterium]|nr:glycosyltransferase family 2 protein [Deltaproteobacteria bacterium]
MKTLTTMSEKRAVWPAVKPDISVIIPMYNAAETIRDCLESILSSQGVRYEVIVVNDASTDHSLAIALEFPCTVISLASNIMAANCRNLGARHAQSDILMFFDADQLMQADTLHCFVNVLHANPEMDAVVGSFAAHTPRSGFFSKFKNLRHHHVHQTANPEGRTLASGLMAIRKSTFDLYGGFEPAYQAASIEDIALGYKLRRNNHRILFRGDIQVVHLKSYTFIDLLVSDIFHRAIPWIEVMIRDRIWNNNLNTKIGNIACVVVSWLMPPLVVISGIQSSGIVVAACIILIWTLNRGLLRAAFTSCGFVFLIQSLLFIPFMYCYQGLGAMAGLACYAFGHSIIGKRPVAETRYEIFQGG